MNQALLDGNTAMGDFFRKYGYYGIFDQAFYNTMNIFTEDKKIPETKWFRPLRGPFLVGSSVGSRQRSGKVRQNNNHFGQIQKKQKKTRKPLIDKDLRAVLIIWVERFESLVLYVIWYYCITNGDNASNKFGGIC